MALARMRLAIGIAILAILAGACGRAPVVTPLRGTTMATTWSVQVADPVADRDALRTSVQASLDRIERLMSTYMPASEVSRFNASRSTDWFASPEELASVVAESIRIHELTGGAFDITLGPVIERWGHGLVEPPHLDDAPGHSDAELIAIRGLDDDGLLALNVERSLYLDLEELRVIRDEYERLGREITDVEIETLAQTWSEHCAHKTFRARILAAGGDDDETDRPLLARLRDCTDSIDAPFVRSAFVGNAGVIALLALMGLAGAVLVFGSESHRMVTDGSTAGFTGSAGPLHVHAHHRRHVQVVRFQQHLAGAGFGDFAGCGRFRFFSTFGDEIGLLSFNIPRYPLSGGESGYVRTGHRERIRHLFPAARFAKIPGAGHWLHAEKPREFEAAVRVFLDAP